jgi:hypothetical protein
LVAGVKERQNVAMSSPPIHSAPAAKPPIRAWRIVGGAFLHFVVPAYLVTVAVVTLFNAPAGASVSDLVRLALGYSGWFLASYGVLTLVTTLAAAALEPMLAVGRRRRLASDPLLAATASRLRVTRALADARALPGADLHRLIDSIGAPRWDHDDSRFQALSHDLDQVIRAMTAANATASAKLRPDIIDLATRSLQQINDALGELVVERSRLDQGDARAIARYVENRYGPSDFTGS